MSRHLWSTNRWRSKIHPVSCPGVQVLRLDISAVGKPHLYVSEKRCHNGRLGDGTMNDAHLRYLDIEMISSAFGVIDGWKRQNVPKPNGVTAPRPVTTTLRISCWYMVLSHEQSIIQYCRS